MGPLISLDGVSTGDTLRVVEAGGDTLGQIEGGDHNGLHWAAKGGGRITTPENIGGYALPP